MITKTPITLVTARARLKEEIRTTKGGVCPCCDRFAKMYKRPLNATMVAGLYWIIDTNKEQDGYVSVAESAPVWLLRSNQHTILKHWGLVEQAPNEDNEMVSDSGRWRPTALGRAFADEKARVYKYALLFNDKCEGLVGELVFAKQIVDRFNYAELMTTGAAA